MPYPYLVERIFEHVNELHTSSLERLSHFDELEMGRLARWCGLSDDDFGGKYFGICLALIKTLEGQPVLEGPAFGTSFADACAEKEGDAFDNLCSGGHDLKKVLDYRPPSREDPGLLMELYDWTFEASSVAVKIPNKFECRSLAGLFFSVGHRTSVDKIWTAFRSQAKRLICQ